ncbi:hypothetical protein NRB20_17990 [Nocardia sp. RB20]|uniref:Plasmid pRiA4b Orf3-like domain-containing protein n=2 Tax=Nocardia macrotermitis TaxID=2585198 RepID=A0A7K0CZ57_9NOCA|nr:hypothetical protein [Nocardia macrotermitis]
MATELPTELDGDDDPFDSPIPVAPILESLDAVTDPLDAELIGAMLLTSASLAGDDAEELVLTSMLPAFEALGGVPAAGLLSMFAVLGTEPIAAAAKLHKSRLTVPANAFPDWIRNLEDPVTVRGCVALTDPEDEIFLLAAYFERPHGAHAMMLIVDPDECGAAVQIAMLEPEELPDALATIRGQARRENLRLTEKPLAPAEFRWHAEVALDHRADHDRGDSTFGDTPEDNLDLGDEDGPGYHLLATLLRARLRTLPLSSIPRPPHGDDLDPDALLSVLEEMSASGLLDTGSGRGTRSLKPAKLPPKRKTRDGRAPILRLRVDLRYAKPPIWRRLEVPGDIPLNELHDVIQTAFGWTNSHLYSFDTDFGTFGRPDPQLGHRADAKTTLEQVAGTVGAKLSYTYDFGDDWEHAIVVEHSGPATASATYPRCTGGRRATPPEDCGGMWGYEKLLEILADPNHPEHADRLEWLGYEHADQHDPAAFDKAAINAALTGRDGKSARGRK